ncbi:MAG TPA: hypothetical protein VF938_03225, partial [Candidatus Angelobacter sp.]
SPLSSFCPQLPGSVQVSLKFRRRGRLRSKFSKLSLLAVMARCFFDVGSPAGFQSSMFGNFGDFGNSQRRM